jgi:hypothetical protein
MTKVTRSAFKTAKNSRFATNGVGAITGSTMRTHEEDTADSVVFIDDDISTNADFSVEGTKLTDRATIKTAFPVLLASDQTYITENNLLRFVLNGDALIRVGLAWRKVQTNADQYAEISTAFRNNGSAITGTNVVIVDAAKIPNDSILHVQAILVGITIDDSGGFESRIEASWWKNAAGTLAKINDTITTNKNGALGDTFTISTANSSGDIVISFSRTGTKSYYLSAFVKNINIVTKK